MSSKAEDDQIPACSVAAVSQMWRPLMYSTQANKVSNYAFTQKNHGGCQNRELISYIVSNILSHLHFYIYIVFYILYIFFYILVL